MINRASEFFLLPIIFSLIISGIVFAAEGDIVWTRTYNGPADDWDFGLDVAVDGNGNVYVTGSESVSADDYNIWVRSTIRKGTKSGQALTMVQPSMPTMKVLVLQLMEKETCTLLGMRMLRTSYPTFG